MGEFCLNRHEQHYTYVASYLTSPYYECYIGYEVYYPMLEVKSLCKSYRGLPAIDKVSFSVGAGQIVGYVGPNGSGKSTTVKIVTGLLEPNTGQVLFEGESIRNNLQGYRAAFGYVPEEAHVYTHLSGLEYLQLVGRLRNMPEALIDLKANRLLGLLGLESWRHSPISLYSKGMKQRVLIAAALLHDPKLLIFDEPLSGLDVVSARLFKDLLQELAAQGKAILYISHVLEVVELVCHRVIVIAKGKILADAPPAALKASLALANLESVFAQLVQQQDTRSVASELVNVMAVHHV
jgi:ABC-2 type transport system ATP-binding protein